MATRSKGKEKKTIAAQASVTEMSANRPPDISHVLRKISARLTSLDSKLASVDGINDNFKSFIDKTEKSISTIRNEIKSAPQKTPFITPAEKISAVSQPLSFKAALTSPALTTG